MADEKTLLQDPEFVEELIRYSDYYHVLGAKKIETGNPFDELFKEDYFRDNPHLALVSLFRDTRFLGYTAKRLFNLDLVPFQVASLQTLWNHTFPMLLASRGASKSFMLAVYCWYKALLVPKSRIIVTGGAFRQSKVVLGYMENIFNNSPVLQGIVGYGTGKGLRKDIDRYTYYVGDSEIIALPIGTGEKIRGMRATTIIVDEFLSVRKDIYEETISAFAAVSANPSLAHKDWAVRQILKKLGRLSKEQEQNEIEAIPSNQSIISGTCSYTFEHFYEYWDRYHKIIASGGDKKKLSQALNGEVDDNFDYRDYAIIRLPVEILPPHFMDEKNIIRAKATIDSGVYLKEYACIFPKDSSGFFKRSLIESCVGTDLRPIELSSGPVFFDVAMAGNRTKKYVMGVDPAAEQDNFAISLIEIWPDHRRLVYVWTTNLKDHRAKVKAQLVREHDYYGYCARKIRDLMKVFNVERIALDKQGGGRALLEALHDKDKIDDDEVPIYEIIDDNKEKDTDNLPGLHIVEVASVSKEDWITGANHGLRKDMEDKALLFPQFDPVSLEIAIQADKHTNKQFDTFEDAVMEIEELKDELSTIVVTRTDNGREHFDTPEIKLSTGKKGRLKKDRYSALLMANMAARTMARLVPDAPYNAYGGLARQSSQSDNSGQLYTGAEWMSNSAYSKSNHNSIVEGNRKIVY